MKYELLNIYSRYSRSHTLYGNEFQKALPSVILEVEPLDKY